MTCLRYDVNPAHQRQLVRVLSRRGRIVHGAISSRGHKNVLALNGRSDKSKRVTDTFGKTTAFLLGRLFCLGVRLSTARAVTILSDETHGDCTFDRDSWYFIDEVDSVRSENCGLIKKDAKR